MDNLIKIINEVKVSDYQIVEQKTVSHQAFFIAQELDQHRISDTKNTIVTVYMDIDGKRGSAKREIQAGETDEQIKKAIEELKFNASIALNPYFELIKDEKYFEEYQEYDLLASLKNVIKAIQAIEDTENEQINSYEIFVNQNYYHVVNSQGVDLSFNKLDEMVEIIITSINKGNEVEIYHSLTCGVDQTVENIVESISNVFKKASDRIKAVPAKKMKNMRVIIEGEDVNSFFECFIEKSNTANIYHQLSQVKVGDVIQEGNDCDKITIYAKRTLPFSSGNQPYTLEGQKIEDVTLIENGIYKAYNGDHINAYYLGLKDVTSVNNFEVKPGSISLAEMQSKPYLKIVQFSDFQVDSITGDFGGEFRLAYYFDGKTTIPVTAGSITSNLKNVLNSVRFSKETKNYDCCVVPQAIEFGNINVAGQE